MQNQKSKTVIVLAVLLVLAVGYIAFGAYNSHQNTKLNTAYQQRFVDAQAVINQNIIKSLNTQGYVPFTAPTSGNKTVTINLVPDKNADFTGVIYNGTATHLPFPDSVSSLQGKKIRIFGIIKEYHGPEIIINSPEQLHVVPN